MHPQLPEAQSCLVLSLSMPTRRLGPVRLEARINFCGLSGCTRLYFWGNLLVISNTSHGFTKSCGPPCVTVMLTDQKWSKATTHTTTKLNWSLTLFRKSNRNIFPKKISITYFPKIATPWFNGQLNRRHQIQLLIRTLTICQSVQRKYFSDTSSQTKKKHLTLSGEEEKFAKSCPNIPHTDTSSFLQRYYSKHCRKLFITYCKCPIKAVAQD